MRYISTRNKYNIATSAEAISQGLAVDGGLFVPETVPQLPDDGIKKLRNMSYQRRAVYIMSMYLEDFTESELTHFTSQAYGPKKFNVPEVAPVRQVDGCGNFLELWHGPTCAFKDMALQILPYLLTASLVKNGEEKQVCILVATSGDTGKAALEGFCDVERTKIIVFYPRDGVSDIQKLQMTTQPGENVLVYAVNGNFDDAQAGVKRLFSDPDLRGRLADGGYFLSSANSINWGRLLPQIVYYISAYCDLLNSGAICEGEQINFCVPTGNFGDILAGYYAKKMGLPVGKLICASNQNDVLTEFIKTGVYNKNRQFFTTISPSMDILVSSNLERLLFDLSGQDDVLISEYMAKLGSVGIYTVNEKMKNDISEIFACGSCSDDETKRTINDAFIKYGYLIDTHTAVALKVMQDYSAASDDSRKSVIVSTASPYKFCNSVLESLHKGGGRSGLELIDILSEATKTSAPEPLAELKRRSERFAGCVEKENMESVVTGFLI